MLLSRMMVTPVRRGVGKTAAIAAVIALGLAASIACQRAPTSPPCPDILLITIDTLRADSLEPYGATNTMTPMIASFAEQSVVYESATTPMPLTRPAHASILTGLYPDQHGVLTNHQILPEGKLMLAETLRDAGYQTAGFTGVRFLNERSGLARGFDAFHAPIKGDSIRGKDVVDLARSWLEDSDPDVPAFLWVHLYDPHQPYNPVRTFRSDIDPELENQIPSVNFRSLNRVARNLDGDVPANVLELALNYYRFEVEYTDFWVGRLLKIFDRNRKAEKSLVIFTADHGECFENGIHFEHADCLYEGALRVPLIVRFPDEVGAGLRVGRRVGLLDIVPTVLSELSLPIPAVTAGIPLQDDFGEAEGSTVLVRLPERRKPERVPFRLRVIRSVAGEPIAPETDPRTRGVVDLMWKYLWTPDSELLFRLPDERSNLAGTDDEVRTRLRRALEEITAKYPPGGAAPEDHDPETMKALEALGYVE